MRKSARNFLLILILIMLVIFPAYGDQNEVEKPIIVIAAGAMITDYSIFPTLLEKAEIEADVQNDLHTYTGAMYFENFTLGEIESGKYRTALFVFGSMDYTYNLPDSLYAHTIMIEPIIRDLKRKIDFCMQNGVKMIGLQCYNSSRYYTWPNLSIRIIEEILPYMDSLVLLYNFGDFPELGDKFVEVGFSNGIPIEYSVDTNDNASPYANAISALSMLFGE